MCCKMIHFESFSTTVICPQDFGSLFAAAAVGVVDALVLDTMSS